MNLKEFGVYFAKLREESGFRSQRELAEKSGVSHSTINRIESGAHKVSPENLKLLAPFLKNVEYDDLMIAMGYLNNSSNSRNIDASSVNDMKEYEAFISNPQHGIFFKEYLAAPEERREEMRKIFEILKEREKDRRPGDKQEE